MNTNRALLVILDGWGLNPDPQVSALVAANTPFMDNLIKNYPNSTLVTYGNQVGLPEGQMGNSEVGHLNIGAGRIVYQDFAKINQAIKDGSFYEHPVFLKAMRAAKQNGKKVHLMGLVSDGGVHAHTSHLRALCKIAESENVQNCFVHAFLDGRDVDPKSGIDYIAQLQSYLSTTSIRLASMIGRYYAMDRDNRWERIKKAYDLMVKGEGIATTNAIQAIQQSYDQGITDEFLESHCLLNEQSLPMALVEEGDTVIFFNFRTDRPREITEALHQKDFPDYGMTKLPLTYVSMTRYSEHFEGVEVAYPKDNIQETLGELIAKEGMSQVRIAETEKYPHVTFFFSGGREDKFEGEDRILVNSPKVATYDLQPEMSALEVTEKIVNRIKTNPPDFICLNYANTDMVGHTGVWDAAIRSAETVDGCLQNLIIAALQNNYNCLVIADHGNSDIMVNPDGSPHTAHTTNLVPCIYVSRNDSDVKLNDGKLADVAPTILSILGINQPDSMTGENLIIR